MRPLLALLAALLLAPALGAQQTGARPLASLRVGDTLRVWAASPAEQVGVLTAPVGDSLAIRRRDGRSLAFPVAALSHVDVQRGRRRSGGRVLLGALGGAAAGLVLGGAAGAASSSDDDTNGLGTLAGFVAGGLAGGTIGLVVGGVVASRFKQPRWEQAYP